MSENSQASNVTPPPSARTDLITAAILLAFSLTIIVLAMRMPSFVSTGTSRYANPDVVPTFHGVVLGLLSLILAIRSLYRGALKPGGGKPAGFEGLPGISLKRLFIAAGLGLLFAIVMVGTLPFWLATAIFVTAFTSIFEWDPAAPMRVRLWRLASAAIIGICVGVGVFLLFQEIFLVRLP